MSPIIEVRGLCHTYSAGTPFEHVAIEQLNFAIEAGEFIGLIGHTGSGKSTLIQHLNGLLKPNAGTVLFQGEDIWKDKKFTRSIRSKVGLVFQYPEYQLFEETAFRDIAFGPRNMGLSEEEIRTRVLRAASFVGVDETLLEKSPFDLSGGQKRRVAIAGVIAMEPEVLILDEPTAGLDAKGRNEILSNIRAYQKAQNATIIMVSHAMEEVAALADRLIVMKDGRIDAIGTPSEIFSQTAHLRSLGLGAPQVTEVFAALREKGFDLPEDVYTLDYAVRMLLACRKGGGQC